MIHNDYNGIYDIAVIGGGINGCGIARDAAGRGLKVFLCEQADLASGASSASSKLIHGGLRYLEQYEFKLVRKALQERETMLQAAPHLIKPMRFILPHHAGLRPIWLIRIGLFLYDLLGGKHSLSRSRWIKLNSHHSDAALKTKFTSGFEYADCCTDDARLVIAVAQDARRLGATISTQTGCDSVTRSADCWQITLCHKDDSSSVIRSKVLVNATGPWVAQFRTNHADNLRLLADKHRIKLVQGSHIVVKKWFAGEHAYILQNNDQRIVFVIPFQPDLVIVGTTETEYHGDPATARITTDEINYLCDLVNQYFTHTLTTEDIILSYSGVRPLYDSGTDDLREMTRDYVIDLEATDLPPMMTIYGGKLTTFRCLAESVLAQLTPYFPDIKPPWTADSILPGGEIPSAEMDKTAAALGKSYPFLSVSLLSRYLSAYGSDTLNMLNTVNTIADMGQHFGHGLYQIEVTHLVKHEWATNAEDVLWRRSKLGLQFDQAQVVALDHWLITECDYPTGITTANSAH